jgi:hypothetical protein
MWTLFQTIPFKRFFVLTFKKQFILTNSIDDQTNGGNAQ